MAYQPKQLVIRYSRHVGGTTYQQPFWWIVDSLDCPRYGGYFGCGDCRVVEGPFKRERQAKALVMKLEMPKEVANDHCDPSPGHAGVEPS